MMGFVVIHPLKNLKHLVINRDQDQKDNLELQIKTNEAKRSRIFTSEESTEFICGFIRKRFSDKPTIYYAMEREVELSKKCTENKCLQIRK